MVSIEKPSIWERLMTIGWISAIGAPLIYLAVGPSESTQDLILGALIMLVIGSGSVIGAGVVVPSGMKIPECSLVIGVPAKIIRSGDASLRERARGNTVAYHKLRDEYLSGRRGKI